MNLNNIDSILDEMVSVKGAIAASVIDWESGMTLGMQSRDNYNIELASAGNSEVLKAKMTTMRSLKLDGHIRDILITLDNQIHILTMVKDHPELVMYIALDSNNANLALARNKMQSLVKM